MKRFANANWKGSGKEGKGLLSTKSTVLKDISYSYLTRFFGEGLVGTNPEELLAAAHASCFSMKLSFVIDEAGYTATNIDTHCDISLEEGVITKSHLAVQATVPGITPEKFEDCVVDAAANCPISKTLAIPVTHEARLV